MKKNYTRKERFRRIRLLLPKQTPPTDIFNWVLITEKIGVGQVYCYKLLVKFTREYPKYPCASRSGWDDYFCSSVFLDAGLAKWGRRKKIGKLEWPYKGSKKSLAPPRGQLHSFMNFHSFFAVCAFWTCQQSFLQFNLIILHLIRKMLGSQGILNLADWASKIRTSN